MKLPYKFKIIFVFFITFHVVDIHIYEFGIKSSNFGIRVAKRLSN